MPGRRHAAYLLPLTVALLALAGCDRILPQPDRPSSGSATPYGEAVTTVTPTAPPEPIGPPPMPELIFDLRQWDGASPEQRDLAARQLDTILGDVNLIGLERYEAGGQSHEIAVYEHIKSGIELSLIPAGSFEMGSKSSEEGRNKDEVRRKVTLTQPFLMARTEITQYAWRQRMGKDPSEFTGDERPVESISMSDVPRFLFRMRMELPTEAQWEWACRAGTTTAYHFGDDKRDLAEYAWFESNADGKTHPVGSKRPNAFGLFDMHGNVWEWCKDGYTSYGSDSVTDPVGSKDASDRVIRGGSWGNMAPVQRSAFRMRSHPGDKHGGLGVRPIRVIKRDEY